MATENGRASASEKLAGFFQGNKKLLIGIVVVLAVFLIAYGVIETVLTKSVQKNLEVIDSISYILTKDSAKLEDSELASRTETALNQLEPYTLKNGVVGVRANMLKASVLYAQNQFAKAADSYMDAAKKSKKSYTAPICYFNAGSSYEDASDTENAEKAYRAAVSFEDFDQLNHAKFSLARLLEQKGDTAGALAAYTELFAATPDDSWGKLAESRLLALEIADKQ